MSPEPARKIGTGREYLAVAGGLLLLSLLMTAPVVCHLGTALPNDLADPLFNAFVLAWDADRFAHLFDGLWDCPFFYPARDVLAYSDHLLGIALFTSPIQWATGNAVLAYNVAFLASYVLAGFGMYLLARALFGRRDAAWIGALAFAFAPHRVGHVSHLQILMSGWIPLGLYALHRYFVTGSRAALALFAAATILQALSSGYLMLFLVVPVALVTLVEIAGWARRRRPGAHRSGPAGWGRLFAELGVTAAVCLLAVAPTAAAYLRVRGATGFRRGIEEMARYSAHLPDYWRVSSEMPLWSRLLEHGALERMLFPGLVTVALAALAVATARSRTFDRAPDDSGRRRITVVALYSAVFGLALWLSLGPGQMGPYRLLLHALPGLDGLRVPARFVVIVALALAVLAAGGAAWLLPRLRSRTRTAVVCALSALILAEGYGGPIVAAPFDPAQRDRRPLNAWLKAAPTGALLELPIAGPELAPFTLGYQYNTLIHRHAIVNGYSGTGSLLQDFLGGTGSPIRDPVEVGEALRGLRAIGVRYVVMHRRIFEDRPALRFPSALPSIEAIDAETGQLTARVQFGDTVAWRLAEDERRPGAESTGLSRLAPSAFTVTASAMQDRVTDALDEDVNTRWSSGAAQTGREWFRVDFGRTVDVGRLVIGTGRFGLADRPRRLVIESEAAGAAPVVLFEGSLVPQLIESIAKREPAAAVPLDFPPNRSRAIVLRQVGTVGTRPWAIHEMEIWVRGR